MLKEDALVLKERCGFLESMVKVCPKICRMRGTKVLITADSEETVFVYFNKIAKFPIKEMKIKVVNKMYEVNKI